MNCVDIRELLSEYIDGELDAEQKNELEDHLDRCGDCRREYNELLKIAELLRAVPEVSLPEKFDIDIRAEIRKEKIKKAYAVKRRWKMVSSIAAVFVIGVFSLTMYNQLDAQAPASTGTGGAMPSSLMLDADGSDVPAPTEEQAEVKEEISGVAEVIENKMASGISLEENLTRSDRDRQAGTEAEYYLKLLAETLSDLDYRVYEHFQDEGGAFIFKVEINAVDEQNINYIERYTYIGQDGKLWREDLSSLTETAY